MRGTVFMETLRTSWKTTLLWGMGMGAFMAFFVLLVPALDNMNLVALMETLPEPVLAAAGVADIQVLATTEGLLALGFFGKMALFFAAYPAFVGMNVTSNEEDEGIMDTVLSLPLPRTQLLLEKFLAYTVNIIALVFLVLGGLYVGLAIEPSVEVNVARMSMITLNLIPVLVFVLAVTIFIGANIGRRQIVLYIVTGFIVVSYSIFTVGGMISASWFDPIEALSFFSYYNVEYLLREGFVLTNVVLLFALAIALMGGSMFIFDRRDIT